MGVPLPMETLSERASFMKESLQKSQTITESMVTILGSFDHRLSALESAMRPTQVKTHAIRRAHENIDKTLKAAEVIIDQFDISRQVEAKIMRGPHEDLNSYLEAVDQLRSNVQFFSSKQSFKSSDGVLSHANGLLAKAVQKLEEEFKQRLSAYSKPVEPDRLFECLPISLRPSTGSPGHHGDSSGKNPSSNHNPEQAKSTEGAVYTLPTLIPPRIIPLLHDLAQQMVQAGHQQQCIKTYRDTRASVLEQSLRKLGVEKLSKDDVQKMQWEVLEAKIGNWIHYMRIAVKLLFAGERKVCEQIFEDIDALKDLCFAEVAANSVAMLLSFGEAIAKSKRSPEKLFVLLDMYEIMHELQPEIEAVFEGKACIEMRESALSLTRRLAQTAEETFGDFEEAVEKDATKTAVQDGTVHPLTSYVINYVKFLFDYQSTLKQLFQEIENRGETNSQLASVTMRIMSALHNNLDGKSKQYKDPALTHLFLMNNIHYMVRSVRRSEAKDLLGDDWVQRHRRVVQQHANQYKRVAWGKITQFRGKIGRFGDLTAQTAVGIMNPGFFLNPRFQYEEGFVYSDNIRSGVTKVIERLAPNVTFAIEATREILQCLSIQGLSSSGGGSAMGTDGGSSSGVSRAMVKDRFKSFNIQFEELHQRQSQWTVPDSELRESLRLAVAEVLLPAYRSFLRRFGPLIENGKNPQKYIRYTAEDLDRMLGEFFEGKTWNEPKR